MNRTKRQHLSAQKKSLRFWKCLQPTRACLHPCVVPPRQAWFLEQGRWSCSSSRCPAAGRLSTQLCSSAVGTQPSQLPCMGPNKSHFSSSPTGDFFWKMAPTSQFHGTLTQTWAEKTVLPFSHSLVEVCVSPWLGRVRKGSQPFMCGLSLVSIFHSSSLSHASHLHWL